MSVKEYFTVESCTEKLDFTGNDGNGSGNNLTDDIVGRERSRWAVPKNDGNGSGNNSAVDIVGRERSRCAVPKNDAIRFVGIPSYFFVA